MGLKNCKLNWALGPEELKAKIPPALFSRGNTTSTEASFSQYWKSLTVNASSPLPAITTQAKHFLVY